MTRAKQTGNYFAGEKGRNRVRLFAHPASGTLYLEWRDETGRKRRESLEHREWNVGKTAADARAADLSAGTKHTIADRVTVGKLFDIYDQEMTPTKARTTQMHDRAAAKRFRKCFGEGFLVARLGQLEWGRFIRTRRDGVLLGGEKVGDRTIEYDLRFLNAVLNWAVKARLITANPCAGLESPHERDPKQPQLTRNEYDAIQRVAIGVSPRFALALTLGWETGRRISSIRHLRWADFDLENGMLLFRKEFDKSQKKGARDVSIPISEAAFAALLAARTDRLRDAQQIGDGWLFPSGRSTTKPLGRRYFLKWWHKAEERAGLAPVVGRGWHSLRRAFVTEMLGSRRVADEVVNSLGGWARGSTVAREVYQHPQLEQQRAAIRTRAG